MDVLETKEQAFSATSKGQRRKPLSKKILPKSETENQKSKEEKGVSASEIQCEAEKEQGEKKQNLGNRGEAAAVLFLKRRGFEILERNWTCAAGEADVIAEDEDDLVFIEVKTRSSCKKGLPEEAVDAAKRKRYERIAGYYLKDHQIVDRPIRFDVISILVVAPERAFLRHHRNAFGAEG